MFDFESLGISDERWIRITSTTETMAELVSSSQAGVLATTAVPTEGTTSEPDLLVFD